MFVVIVSPFLELSLSFVLRCSHHFGEYLV